MKERAETAPESYRRRFLGLLVITVTVLFLLVMRRFIMTILLAAIFSAILNPLYKSLVKVMRGHTNIASLTTIIIVILVILVPLGLFAGILVSQAIQVTQNAQPWIESQLDQGDAIERWVEGLPNYERILPYKRELMLKLGEFARSVGGFFVNTLSSATKGTFMFLLHLVLMLYAMYFFLIDGRRFLSRIGAHVPLSQSERKRIMDRFVNVTRAALASTIVIGVVQGLLGGLAMAVVGIPGAVFWGTLMALLSMLPGIGATLIWLPAGIYLLAVGQTGKAVLFMLFCALIVGSADNVLRPRLIGKDTKLPELVILFSTLGGIMLLGPLGFIIGPVIAAVFVTVWDIYAAAMVNDKGPATPARSSAKGSS